jgi:hypothetical protein
VPVYCYGTGTGAPACVYVNATGAWVQDSLLLDWCISSAGGDQLLDWGISTSTASTMSTTATVAGPVWQSWNIGYTDQDRARSVHAMVAEAGQRLADQVEASHRAGDHSNCMSARCAEHRLQEEARNRELDAATRARHAARDRARALLLELLSPAQRIDYLERGYFDMVGSAGRRWRIRATGQAGNVHLMGAEGQTLASACCHPPGHLPNEDAHVAQMLHLAADEDGFVQTANISWHVPRRSALAAGLLQAA